MAIDLCNFKECSTSFKVTKPYSHTAIQPYNHYNLLKSKGLNLTEFLKKFFSFKVFKQPFNIFLSLMFV